MEKYKPKILFDSSTAYFILDAFDKDIDIDGYIVERGTKKRVLSIDGKEIKETELAGICKFKNNVVFIKDDLYELMKFYDMQAKERG